MQFHHYTLECLEGRRNLDQMQFDGLIGAKETA